MNNTEGNLLKLGAEVISNPSITCGIHGLMTCIWAE